MTKTKRVSICFDGGDDWPPERAADFMGWFQAKLRNIPSQYRGSATIAFNGGCYGDGDSYTEITISYERPETPEERADREDRIRKWGKRPWG